MKNCPKCNYPMKIKTFRDFSLLDKILYTVAALHITDQYTAEPEKYICTNCKREIVKHYNEK